MRYSSYRPPAPLDNFIDFFWLIARGETDRKERILPSGTSELVINLREDDIRIYDPIRPQQYKKFSGAVVSGTYSRVFACDANQHQLMLGAHFKPGGALPLLGAAASELRNYHANLEDLWGALALELRARLCEATTTRQRFQLIEEVFLERIRRATKRPPAIEAALRWFGPGGGGSSTREVARELGLSQRRFIQVFAHHAGLTPKLFCRILRFQRARVSAERAVSGLAEAKPQRTRLAIDWAQMALTCGYYDQAHLINDFQTFAGLSPLEYLRQLQPAQRLKDNHVPLEA